MNTPGHQSSVVGVVGLGIMGGLIAKALHDAGRAVVAFDVNPDAVARAAEFGASTADSVTEIGSLCDVVVLSLPTPTVVRSVVADLAGVADPPMVLDTSTSGPDTAQFAQSLLAKAGGDYADCPILGRPTAVGSWTIPVGGPAELVELARRTLAPAARNVVRVGEVGSAATLKVLNNLMLGTINAVTAEVLVLADAAGLDPGVFVDTVVESGAASVSGLFRDIAPRAVKGDYEPTFSLGLMRKDNALALALAEQHNVPMPVGTAVQTLNTMGVSAGFAALDSIAIVKVLEQLTGSRVCPRPSDDQAS